MGLNWYNRSRGDAKPYNIYKITGGHPDQLLESLGIVWADSAEQARALVLKDWSALREFIDFCIDMRVEGDVVARLNKEKWEEAKKDREQTKKAIEETNRMKEERIPEMWWNKD